MPQNVRFNYFDPSFDYQVGTVEAIAVGQSSGALSESDAPLALNRKQAQAIAERWLAEIWTARDRIELALAPSQIALEPGDAVRVPDDPDTIYRLEEAENAGEINIEASRIDTGVFLPATEVETVEQPRSTPAPAAPVVPVFMDLPLISGDEVAHQAHVAAFAADWPGRAAVYESATEDGFTLSCVLRRPATIGTLTQDLEPAAPNRWSRATMTVRLAGGALDARSALQVLNGANAAAVERTDGEWEVIQFQNAALKTDGDYELDAILRGQAGTDELTQTVVLAGARFVLLDGAPEQLPTQLSARGLERHYRIGPAAVEYTDPSYVAENHAFAGVGLRPYAPAHLRVSRSASGDLTATWIRRSRIGGDSLAGR